MPVLMQSQNGGSTTKSTVAITATSAEAANKVIEVTSPQVITTAVTWPSDRELKFRKGGYVTFTGGGSLTGLKEVRPENFGADPTGATSSTVAFTKMFASGATIFKGTPGATYKLKDVPLPANYTGFEFDGNWSTIVPDAGAVTCFHGDFTTDVRYLKMHRFILAGSVPDFIKIESSGTDGYFAYVTVADIKVESGTGTSIVKFVTGTAAQPEVLIVRGINTKSTDPLASYDHAVHLTGIAAFGSCDFGDIIFFAPTNTAVIKADVAVLLSKFNWIFGVGTILDMFSCQTSELGRLESETIFNNAVVLTGEYLNCKIDTLANYTSRGNTGDKLIDGTLINCHLSNLFHYRTGGLGAGGDSVILSADSTDNTFTDLQDAINSDSAAWYAVTDSGFRNKFQGGKNGPYFYNQAGAVQKTVTSGAATIVATIPAGELGYYDSVSIEISGRAKGAGVHAFAFYLEEFGQVIANFPAVNTDSEFRVKADISFLAGTTLSGSAVGSVDGLAVSAGPFETARSYAQALSLSERVVTLDPGCSVVYNTIRIQINRARV